MDSTTPAELDETLGLLRNARRRFVLHYLRHQTPRADVSELAAALARWESADGPGTDRTPTTVELSLSHVHLPKLAEAGVLSYDRGSGRVTLGDATELDPYLSNAERVDRPVGADADDDDD